MSTRPIPAPGSPRDLSRRLVEEREFLAAIHCLEPMLAEASSDVRAWIAADLADLAERAADAGDRTAAIHALEVATAAVDWADLWCRLGILRVEAGRRTEARAAFDRALAIHPRYRAARLERALLDAGEGRIASALESLQMLAGESVVREPGLFAEGLERLAAAEFERASDALRRGLETSDAWLAGQLAAHRACLVAGDTRTAGRLLRDALAERPGYPDLHLLIGVHEAREGALDDALTSLVRALELNPDYHAARVELARVLDRLGDRDQAIAQLEQVLAAEPDHAAATEALARLTGHRRSSEHAVSTDTEHP